MKKIFNKKNFKKLLYLKGYSFILIIATIVVWEQSGIRTSFYEVIESEPVTVEREVVEVEETIIEELANTRQAIEAGEACQIEEAKKMRLEDIAEEAKNLQESLK